MNSRHTGPFSTRRGVLPPTGQTVRVTALDLLTVTDGRISAVWTVAEEPVADDAQV